MTVSTITVSIEVRMRRGAIPFLIACNAVRKFVGLPVWVPNWIFEVKTHAIP
jgi:hypothetical protein